MSINTTNIDQRQMATMIAALRYWQREGLMSGGAEHELACDGDVTPLDEEEIDTLIEGLQFGFTDNADLHFCDECGAQIGACEQMVSRDHFSSCSLHPTASA